MSHLRILRTTAVTLAMTVLMTGTALADHLPQLPPIGLPQLPLELVRLGPSDGRTVFVEKVAGGSTGESPHWRLHLDVWVKNTSLLPVALSSVGIGYTGGSDPATITRLLPTIIGPGRTVKIIVPEERHNPYPLPTSTTIQLIAPGFGPWSFTRTLANYINPVVDGYRWFGKAADLPDGAYWSTPLGDRLTSQHRTSPTQRFAFDVGVVRQNANGVWTQLEAGGTVGNNEDYLGFGMPVYAMHDGEVMQCFRNVLENTGSGGGNSFWIRHANNSNEYVLYAHMKEGSISEKACPPDKDGVVKPGIFVKAGDKLGEMGNTGDSDTPHVHVHAQVGHVDFDEGLKESQMDGRPLLFANIWVTRRINDVDPNGFGAPGWNFLGSNRQAADYPQLIMDTNPQLLSTGTASSG